MAFTQDDLDALDEAIASGELSVDFGDRKVVYRSIEQLKSAKAHIESCMAKASGKRRPSSFRVNVSKGV